jgi:hypothetical protein
LISIGVNFSFERPDFTRLRSPFALWLSSPGGACALRALVVFSPRRTFLGQNPAKMLSGRKFANAGAFASTRDGALPGFCLHVPPRVAKRINHEASHRDADAGIGDIESRPGIGEGQVQIEEKEIDHVTVGN